MRAAYLDLRAADERVRVARSAADLANQQMTQAQDRFSAGVASHVEVVQAQEAVATESENLIASLFAHNLAKAALARATGVAEDAAERLLGATAVTGQTMNKDRVRKILAALAVVLVLGAAAWWWSHARARLRTTRRSTATSRPVASRVGGTVLEVKVVDNQPVDAGALLVQIDSRDYEVALSRAKADLADAAAALEAARTGIPITATTTSSQVTTATAAVERSGAGVAIAGKDVDAARSRLAAAQARSARGPGERDASRRATSTA